MIKFKDVKWHYWATSYVVNVNNMKLDNDLVFFKPLIIVEVEQKKKKRANLILISICQGAIWLIVYASLNLDPIQIQT